MADTTETIFDPLAALSDEQRALIPLLKESAVALAQDDREKTWLSTSNQALWKIQTFARHFSARISLAVVPHPRTHSILFYLSL